MFDRISSFHGNFNHKIHLNHQERRIHWKSFSFGHHWSHFRDFKHCTWYFASNLSHLVGRRSLGFRLVQQHPRVSSSIHYNVRLLVDRNWMDNYLSKFNRPCELLVGRSCWSCIDNHFRNYNVPWQRGRSLVSWFFRMARILFDGHLTWNVLLLCIQKHNDLKARSQES